MTGINSAHDLLKPFQMVLDALATREERKSQARQQGAGRLASLPSIRRQTSKRFFFWHRVTEAIHSPESIRAAMDNLAMTTAAPLRAAEPAPPLPDSLQLAKSRAGLARAKATNSRLQSLEQYLSLAETPKPH